MEPITYRMARAKGRSRTRTGLVHLATPDRRGRFLALCGTAIVDFDAEAQAEPSCAKCVRVALDKARA